MFKLGIALCNLDSDFIKHQDALDTDKNLHREYKYALLANLKLLITSLLNIYIFVDRRDCLDIWCSDSNCCAGGFSLLIRLGVSCGIEQKAVICF